jgi:ribosomal-protein-alanine N-acetyltransferase
MRLDTERLILREWRSSDLDDLVDGLNDLAVAKWLASVPHPYTRRHGIAWLQYCSTSAKNRPRHSYEFAIVLKSDSKLIGGASLDRINRHHGTAGGGIWINARYHHHGYGTEAFTARLKFAFEKLGLRRIENGFLHGNEASRKMLEGLGYKEEGVGRKRFLCMADGILKDECQMALFHDDWRNRVQI